MKTEPRAIIEVCRKKIQDRLGLRNPPVLTIKIRSFAGPDKRGRYRLERHSYAIDESAEMLCKYGYYNKLVQTFKETYLQLGRDREKQVPYEAYLIEPVIRFGKVAIAGGHNWIIVGKLKSGENFAAILDVEVRPLLRCCSLMTLMKHEEINLAGGKGCDFLQTWHSRDNRSFLPAIIPGLKAGFVLYHGSSTDGEDYEDKGCIHLRYYFKELKKHKVTVYCKDGTTFQSPADNLKIIEHLKRFKQYPGREIAEVKGHG